jgi:hypothetical protein
MRLVLFFVKELPCLAFIKIFFPFLFLLVVVLLKLLPNFLFEEVCFGKTDFFETLGIFKELIGLII